MLQMAWGKSFESSLVVPKERPLSCYWFYVLSVLQLACISTRNRKCVREPHSCSNLACDVRSGMIIWIEWKLCRRQIAASVVHHKRSCAISLLRKRDSINDSRDVHGNNQREWRLHVRKLWWRGKASWKLCFISLPPFISASAWMPSPSLPDARPADIARAHNA